LNKKTYFNIHYYS